MVAAELGVTTVGVEAPFASVSDRSETGLSLGSSASTRPTFVIGPLSTSSWLIVYVAVQISLSPGARTLTVALVLFAASRAGEGGVVPVPLNALSVTETASSVTLPVF